jgi:uroporphyrinogen-III synthase
MEGRQLLTALEKRGSPPMETTKVLSTKKLLPEIIEDAKENGFDIIEQEAIAIQPILTEEKEDQLLSWFNKKPIQPIVFTSANAVTCLGQYLGKHSRREKKDMQVFCLSGRTKVAVMETFPMAELAGTSSSAKALAELIIARGINEVVFFCGNKRRDELPGILKQNGVVVHEVVVYETVPTPFTTKEDMDAVLFFSPSAVDSFFSLNQLKKNIICFAVGETTADSILKYSGNTIIISDTPSQEGMLKALKAYKHLITQPDN